MVKNKKRFKRPTETKRAGSETGSSKDPPPLDVPASSDVPATLPQLQAAAQGFPDKVYVLASAIFQNQHLEKPAAHRLVNYGNERGLTLPEVKDDDMQRAAYELAFNSLKCTSVTYSDIC